MDDGPEMTPTTKGDNVLLTYENSIYTLSRLDGTYQWIELDQKLSAFFGRVRKKLHSLLTQGLCLLTEE